MTALTLRKPAVPADLPAIPIKNAVVFPIPNLPVPLSVGRDRTLKAIEAAAEEGGLIFVVTQHDPDEEEPGPADVYEVGTLARILRLNRAAEGASELLIEGISRARIERFVDTDPFFRVEIRVLTEDSASETEMDALARSLKEFATKVIQLTPRIPDEAVAVVEGIDNPAHLADLVASQLRLNTAEKQRLLELTDVRARITKVIDHLAREAEVLEISNHIRTEVRDSLDKHQREVYLREQLRAIQKELGEDEEEEGDDLEQRIEAAGMPLQALKAARREYKRLKRMNPQSAEYTVSRSYIDWLLDVPWSQTTQDTLDIKAAEDLLERDHYGLAKVKKRIVEYLAVRKLKNDMKGPILCLVGPPGVGKTSLGKSIAEALGRKFVRISLGGVRDEAEIRGHRRTYVGSLPGRMIKALKRAGTMNPVVVLDEIDKLGNDFRGDPAAALLEVLDPEQNDSFSDHYLEVPVDLSRVLFITTANQLDPIPPALRDRMEVIEIPGYIEEEKREIARRHLIPRQLDDHGLTPEQVTISDDGLTAIINHYTREAGVRNLDRQIAGCLRSIARDVALGTADLPVHIAPDRVRTALGPQRIFPESKEDMSMPGVAIGLAWTPVGGDILFIEVTSMPGKAQLKLTGQLGEVMKESAHTALSWIHARAARLNIPDALFTDRSIHLHLPAGGIPKDGPSAGITIVTALTSLLTGIPMKDAMAMTGEITLRGVVLPVGGIKEKVLAAARAGMKDVILPRRNEGDLEEIPAHLRSEIRFHPVDRIEEVLEIALGVQLRPAASILVTDQEQARA